MSERDPSTLLVDAAIIDPGAWQIVDVTGSERQSFLHRLLTATVDDLAPGQGRRGLLLTVKAQIVAEMVICVGAEVVRLLVPPGQGEALVAALSRYAIMDDVTIALAPPTGLLAVYGERSAARLVAAGVPLDGIAVAAPLAHADVAIGSGAAFVVRVAGYGGTGFWILAAEAALAPIAAALVAAGVPRLSEAEAEFLRVRAGEPRTGHEITDEVFPMEVGLDGLIDYGKGCYLGQEPIVRVRDRGHVNWRLVRLQLREPGLIVPGDRLTTEARPKAGRITSVAGAPGAAAALALLHVSIPDGAVVQVRAGADGDKLLAADVIPAPRA